MFCLFGKKEYTLRPALEIEEKLEHLGRLQVLNICLELKFNHDVREQTPLPHISEHDADKC